MATTEEKFFFNSEANKASFGLNGFEKLTAGQSYSGNFLVVEAWEDSDITFDSNAEKGDANFNDKLEKGRYFYGNLSNINVTTGKVYITLI